MTGFDNEQIADMADAYERGDWRPDDDELMESIEVSFDNTHGYYYQILAYSGVAYDSREDGEWFPHKDEAWAAGEQAARDLDEGGMYQELERGYWKDVMGR